MLFLELIFFVVKKTPDILGCQGNHFKGQTGPVEEPDLVGKSPWFKYSILNFVCQVKNDFFYIIYNMQKFFEKKLDK